MLNLSLINIIAIPEDGIIQPEDDGDNPEERNSRKSYNRNSLHALRWFFLH